MSLAAGPPWLVRGTVVAVVLPSQWSCTVPNSLPTRPKSGKLISSRPTPLNASCASLLSCNRFIEWVW